MNTQSSRRHAAPSLPARNSFVLATVAALAGTCVGVSSILAWQAFDDDRDTPVTTTNIVPGSGVTSDSIQPSSREAPIPRHFTGRTGHVDSDPSVLLDFINEAPEREFPFPPSYPESRQGQRGHVSP